MSQGPKTDSRGQIQTGKRGGADTLVRLLDSMKGEIARALPKHLTPDRMARVSLTALRTVPGLVECSPASFAASIMTLSQLGLEPCTPLQLAYLIPRKIKGRMEATALIGYQGLLELARRSGQLEAVWSYPVYEGDHFRVTYGLRPNVEHEPAFAGADDRALTHVYAAAKLKGVDAPTFVCLTRAEVEGFRKRGGERSFSPWSSDYAAMAQKTAVRRLYKWLPKSIEVAAALRADEAPELGRSQIEAVSDEVRGVLERQGFELPEDASEAIDVETGEVTNAEAAPVEKTEPEPKN